MKIVTKINILENENSMVESDRNDLLMNEIVKLVFCYWTKRSHGRVDEDDVAHSLRKFIFLAKSGKGHSPPTGCCYSSWKN